MEWKKWDKRKYKSLLSWTILYYSIFLWDNCISACHQHLLFYSWLSCSISKRNSSLWHKTSKAACVQFSSVAQSCPALCDTMDCSTLGLPVHHQLLELAQTHVHRVSDAIQPSHPLSSPSPPAVYLSQHQGLFQWVCSSIRWPKYCSFSFSISPSNEYSGLISFWIDWFDLLAVQETLKSLLQTTVQKHQFLVRIPILQCIFCVAYPNV